METVALQNQECAIDIRQLTKKYGAHWALRGIDLKVRQGEFLTVFGPNGAGKTTMLKVLATLVKPSSGSALIRGYDVARDATMVRRQIGVVTHQALLYDDLSAYENLEFYGKMYDVPNKKERIRQLVTEVGLLSRLHDPVRTLSRGMQQRLSVARALMHDPPILLLDEPGTGLDQQASAMLIKLLRSNGRSRRTVVMTTHSLEQGLALGDRVVILTQGKIVYNESSQLDLSSFREVYYHHTGVRD